MQNQPPKFLIWALKTYSKKWIAILISILVLGLIFFGVTAELIKYSVETTKAPPVKFILLIPTILIAYGFKELLKKVVLNKTVEFLTSFGKLIPFKYRKKTKFLLSIGETLIFASTGFGALTFYNIISGKPFQLHQELTLMAGAIFFYSLYGYVQFMGSVHFLLIKGSKRAKAVLKDEFNRNPNAGKWLLPSISLIKSITKPQSDLTLNSESLKEDITSSFLSFNSKSGYSLICKGGFLYDIKSIENLNARNKKLNISIPNYQVSRWQIPKEIEGRVDSFHSEGFSKDNISFYRVFIPISKQHHLDNFTLESNSYSSERYSSHIGLYPIQLNEKSFDCYKYKNKLDGSYLVIESNEELDYHSFSDAVFSITVSLGYLTGKFHAEHGFFFSYEDSKKSKPTQFLYQGLRPSLYSFYHPSTLNAHSMMGKDSTEEAEALNNSGKLKKISIQQFNKLCGEAHNSVEFSSILLLVLEATQSSLLVMPSSLAVALECLCKYIMKDEPSSKVTPVKDERLAEEIESRLHETIEEFKEKLSSDSYELIEKHLKYYNRERNLDKLSSPFDTLDINLNKKEEKALTYRNALLHGNITLKSTKKPKTLEESNQKLMDLSYVFITLCNALIMKKIGFNGMIIDYRKWISKESPRPTPFREI